jgi:hypothetical protein
VKFFVEFQVARCRVYVNTTLRQTLRRFVVTYVDDKTIDYFATEFKKISDLDLIRDRAKRTITLSQSPYASHIGAKHSKSDGNTVPMRPTFDVYAKGDGSNQPIHEEIDRFQYLADHNRPDMLASVSIMGSGTANPHDEHVKGGRTFAEYIAISYDVRLTLGGEPESIYSNSVMPRISRSVIVSRGSQQF